MGRTQVWGLSPLQLWLLELRHESNHRDLSTPVSGHPTRQREDSDRFGILNSKDPLPLLQPSLHPDWSSLTRCHLLRDFTKVTVCVFFINIPALLTPQLDNENHCLGRSGETFLVSANIAAWWHINVIYQCVYVAGLVGHFYASLEQGCCVSA